FNQKGGTAKTTSTLNVAAALSERGLRVLAMDLDPQASLTMAFGVDVSTLEQSVYDLFLDDDLAVVDVSLPTGIEHVRLVPSHPDFATAEMALINELERERLLQGKLRGIELDAFDFILIDAPPALGLISINILVATDDLIIPIEPHPLSLLVLPRLFETVQKIRRLNPEMRVLGFLPTKVHSTSRLVSDMLENLRERYPEIAVLPAVPLSVKGAESVAAQTSILEYMPRSPLSTAYRDVAAHLLAVAHPTGAARV
ncbi:MAG: ParA family protein, partial [Vicinamibacterales bacterium]